MAVYDDVRSTAKRLGLDPDLAAAVAEQESGGNPNAVSPKGAQGTMQVMPDTAKELAAQGYTDNISQGSAYLKQQLDALGDIPEERRTEFALGAYNAGPGALARARKRAKAAGFDDTDFGQVAQFLPQETRNYVLGVLKRVKRGNVTATFDPNQVEITPDDLLAEAGVGAQDVRQQPTGDLTPESLLAEAQNPDQGRGLVGAAIGRTIGRLPGTLDAALGGAPSALAGYAGAKSAGDEAGAQAALEAGGGSGHRLMNVGLGLLELYLTGKYPGSTAAGAGVGTGLEAATGSRTAGDVGEIATGLAAPVAKLGKAALGTERAGARVASDLAADTTLREAGEGLQAPGRGAREAIHTTAERGKALYGAAQHEARTAGAALSPGDTALRDAVKGVDKELKGYAASMPSGVRKAVMQIKRAGRGAKSKLVSPSGGPASVGRKAVGVDELIEMQSNLRREIGKLPRDHVARRALRSLDDALENAIDRGSQAAGAKTRNAVTKARSYYRETVIPTRKSGNRVANAETPESAAKMAQQPSRFERITAASPSSAEPTRSAFFNDLIGTSEKGGGFDIGKLSTRLDAAKRAGTLANMVNTPARRRAVEAIHLVAKSQNAAGRLPLFGPLAKAALRSDRAANVLYRLAHAKAGSPGWKLAVQAAKRIAASEPVGAAARVAGDQEG